jgi:predicted nucleic acid-binding protein
MMARKADRHYLLDTSAVIYRLHGHMRQRAAVEAPVFVRMEYLRGVIVNLIDMHSLIVEATRDRASLKVPYSDCPGHDRDLDRSVA